MNAGHDDFSVQVTLDGPDRVVTVSGEIDLAAEVEFRAALEGVIGEGRRIVLDLAGVRFMDSTGLNVVLQSLKQARHLKGDLVTRSVSGPVRRVLEISGAAGHIVDIS